MRFDTAVDVTASELRVELVFPADEQSAAYFRREGWPLASNPAVLYEN